MKVIIAYDGSKHSEKAFEWYFCNIHKDDNEVTVFCHMDKPDIPTSLFGGVPVLMYEEIQMLIAEHKEKQKNMTEALTNKCAEYGDRVTAVVETADENAGRSVVKKAEEIGAEMIVTGTRGLGTFRRTILGSVSDHIVHHAKVPVIICHL